MSSGYGINDKWQNCQNLLIFMSDVEPSLKEKPRAMHVSIEKAIALSEKPPFGIIQVICRLLENKKEVFYE